MILSQTSIFFRMTDRRYNAILLKIQYNFDNIWPARRRNYDNKKINYLPRITATETNWFRSIKRILFRPKWLLNTTSVVDSRGSQRASNWKKQLLSDLSQINTGKALLTNSLGNSFASVPLLYHMHFLMECDYFLFETCKVISPK